MDSMAKLCNLENILEEVKREKEEISLLDSQYRSRMSNYDFRLMEKSIHDLKISLNEENKKYKSLEEELSRLTDEVEGIEGRLYGGKVTDFRDLEALDIEKKLIDKVIDKNEDQMLFIMESMDLNQMEISQAKASLSKSKDSLVEIHKDYISKREKSLIKILDLEKNINDLERYIDKDILKKYYRIKASKGKAIARLEDGACTACNMINSISNINNYKRGEGLVTCESCGRILY